MEIGKLYVLLLNRLLDAVRKFKDNTSKVAILGMHWARWEAKRLEYCCNHRSGPVNNKPTKVAS